LSHGLWDSTFLGGGLLRRLDLLALGRLLDFVALLAPVAAASTMALLGLVTATGAIVTFIFAPGWTTLARVAATATPTRPRASAPASLAIGALHHWSLSINWSRVAVHERAGSPATTTTTALAPAATALSAPTAAAAAVLGARRLLLSNWSLHCKRNIIYIN
ncbi:hypothetical protein Vafri_278, partial [Volvox africanus]